ncbi:MAG: NADH:flavin oxidoreductase, partial [Desulfobacteraceae bacterium]
MEFNRLFEPIIINKMELRNRIVMPAMHLNYTSDGSVTDKLVRFYEERARGGVGLIIVGGCLIDEWSGGITMIGLHKDEYIPGLQTLTGACHAHGAKIGAQLYMAGAYAHQVFIRRQPLSSSEHRSRFTKDVAKAMSKEEIDMVINDFATAASRAKQGGFDQVEILGSAGYLISQFLSPVINHREDEYGGPFENRMRFGLEVIRAVRDAVGSDFCVGIRLAGNDFVPGSHTNKESAMFAKACQEAGVDMINVTGGWHETRVPQITADLPRAGFAYLARGIREAVTIPVAVSNRINRPEIAEELLQEGFGDLVCLGRPTIADPELPLKTMEGRSEEVRSCIACNQKCFDHVFQLKPVGCLVNALAGEEYKVSIKPAASPKKVLVVG